MLSNFAPKLFISQVHSLEKDTQWTESKPRYRFCSLVINRAWIQGTVIACESNSFYLDDGTDTIKVVLLPALLDKFSEANQKGRYLMVTGPIKEPAPGGERLIQCWKVSDLSSDPNRETQWLAEVMYLYKNNYSKDPS
eukprot:TRINITY_DN13395_c0_g1_i1.p1 TRINITY_DN13395_c0_g1~~TRINITY_DN13395_c0_g1_i1.p1  ORF type:complete len:138 (-),score=10.54 TRINITY_DN13395_c0_g1_i1:257-670(-)